MYTAQLKSYYYNDKGELATRSTVLDDESGTRTLQQRCCRYECCQYNQRVNQLIENEYKNPLANRSVDSRGMFHDGGGEKMGLTLNYLHNPNIQITFYYIKDLFDFVNDPNNRRFSCCSIGHLKFGNIAYCNYNVKEILTGLVNSKMLPNLSVVSFGKLQG